MATSSSAVKFTERIRALEAAEAPDVALLLGLDAFALFFFLAAVAALPLLLLVGISLRCRGGISCVSWERVVGAIVAKANVNSSSLLLLLMMSLFPRDLDESLDVIASDWRPV